MAAIIKFFTDERSCLLAFYYSHERGEGIGYLTQDGEQLGDLQVCIDVLISGSLLPLVPFSNVEKHTTVAINTLSTLFNLQTISDPQILKLK